MDKSTQEWIRKAEEDFEAAITLRRTRRAVFHNAVCFHAQQCVEKYLKALLESKKVEPRKIHALPVLLDQCAVHFPLLAVLRPDMIRLSVYAVEFRYPGESAVATDVTEALKIMKRSRRDLRNALSLS